MVINALNPYWWMASPITQVNTGIDRVDVGGIFKLSTNAVTLTDTTVDYGINPCVYNALPCESLVLLTIHADVPEGGEALPVTIVTPNNGTSTVSTNGSNSGTTKTNIVDSQGTNVTGSNITGSTQRFVYINKRTGIIRFMEFTNA